jgi:hypothetical protein
MKRYGFFCATGPYPFLWSFGRCRVTQFSIAIALVSSIWMSVAHSTANAAPCLVVTLTGTQGGPEAFNGLAGAGTLVSYGDDGNSCGAVKLQFDAGRGTNMRLSQIGVEPGQLNAIFITHMHSDHTEGFPDIMQLRWFRNSAGPKIDVVCSSDVVSSLGFTISCRKFVTHIGDAFLQSGEIALRHSEDKERLAGGPADLANVISFEPKNEPQGPERVCAHALSAAEKQSIVTVSNSNAYRDLSPWQIVARLADQGRYLGSQSSFYRVLKQNDLLAHRQQSKPHVHHRPRDLTARNPNEVWSWDITYLNSAIRGAYYYLYLVEDIFSRMIVGWAVEEVESAEHSARLIDWACREHGIARGQLTLHADNGAPVKGTTLLATLERLGVACSFSRPRVSDDNPYSESLFKTLKYRPSSPESAPLAGSSKPESGSAALSGGTTLSTSIARSAL